MTVPFPLAVLALVAAIGLGAFITWAIYPLLPEKISLRDQTIIWKYRGKQEQMPISDISEIKYHYHAVVGFVAVWEFIDRSAKRLLVHGEAKGIETVLSSLENALTGFSLVEFQRKFDEGDVQDVIDVWKAS